MPDWYKTHRASPDCYPESEYREWAQDNGLYVDLAGNVDYGPPEPQRASDLGYDDAAFDFDPENGGDEGDDDGPY